MNSYIITNEVPEDVWSNYACRRVRDKWNGYDVNSCRITSISAEVLGVSKITKKTGFLNMLKSLIGKDIRLVEPLAVSDVCLTLGETMYVTETAEHDSECFSTEPIKSVEFLEISDSNTVMSFSALNSLQKVTYSADEVMTAFMEDYSISEYGEFCLYMRTKHATYKFDFRLKSVAVHNLPLEHDWTQLGNEKLTAYAHDHNLKIGDDVAVRIAYSDFAIKNGLANLDADVAVDNGIIVLNLPEHAEAAREEQAAAVEGEKLSIQEMKSESADSTSVQADDSQVQPKTASKRTKIKKKVETPSKPAESNEVSVKNHKNNTMPDASTKIKKVKSVKIKKVTAHADSSVN